MAMQREIRDSILANWLRGSAPQTIEGVYGTACAVAGDPGTSLLLCHNVLKSMARGSYSLPWNRVRHRDPTAPLPAEVATNLLPRVAGVSLPVLPDDYTDGAKYYRAKILNTQSTAFLKRQAEASGNEYDSIWYLLFDRTSHSLGTEDAGDWYHFFLLACLGYYALKERVSGLEGNEELGPDNSGSTTIDAAAGFAWTAVRNLIEGIQNWEIRTDTLLSMSPMRRAWVWGNSLSYLEGSYFGSNVQDLAAPPSDRETRDVLRESSVHRAGLLFGLSLADPDAMPDLDWRWWVPVPGRFEAARLTSPDAFLSRLADLKEVGPGTAGFTQGSFSALSDTLCPLGSE